MAQSISALRHATKQLSFCKPILSVNAINVRAAIL